MRQALNSNPIAQVAVIGVMAIVVAFMLFTRVLNRDEGTAATPPAGAPAAPASPTPAPSTPPETAPQADSAAPAPSADGAAPAPSADGATPPAPASPPVATTEFVAGPGLPKDVVNAYADGHPVVLLVIRKGGIDDKRLRALIDHARSVGDSAVFTTPAHDVARYSRITRGVDVSRVPALVVLRPRRLNEGPVPEATVSYGFRGPESVEQAVRDALYDGPRNLPYHPK